MISVPPSLIIPAKKNKTIRGIQTDPKSFSGNTKMDKAAIAFGSLQELFTGFNRYFPFSSSE